ncbi:MAG: FtsX-like permease family protein [Dehalococcoidia bacterium]
MLLLARKNLFSERTSLVISVGGVALSVFLISLLLALFRGWSEKVGGFVEDSPVDVWIGTVGTNDFLTAASIIPLDDAESLDEIPAVSEWGAVIVRPLSANAVEISDNGDRGSDTKVDLHLIGYDPATGIGGPIKVIDGKETPGPDEVIIDKAVRTRYGVGIGDIIDAGGKDWSIVGISDGGDFVGSQTVFVALDQAQDALQMVGLTTFIAMRLEPNIDPVAFARSVEEEQPGTKAFTRAEFAEATREQVLGDVLPILTIILVLAFIVGLAVAGLTIYTATIEKSREFGILKAVGFKNNYLYRLVFEQSLVTGALGFVIGLGLTLVFGPFAAKLVPQFVTFVRWQDVIAVFFATLVMTLIAGYVPVRRLSAIDPTSVFKA